MVHVLTTLLLALPVSAADAWFGSAHPPFSSGPVTLPAMPAAIASNSHSRIFKFTGDGSSDRIAAPAIALINQTSDDNDPAAGWLLGVARKFNSEELAVKSVITIGGDFSRGGAITFRNFRDDGSTNGGGFGLSNSHAAVDTGAVGSLFPIGFTTIGYGAGSGENFTAWLKLIRAGTTGTAAQNLIQAPGDDKVNIGWQLGTTYRHFLQTWDGNRYAYLNTEGVGGVFQHYVSDDSTNNAEKATSVLYRGANKTAGTGDGGDTTIDTGTSAGGAKGIIKLANGGTTAFEISAAGVLTNKLSGSEATGGGSAALGANSPASTNTAPYIWLKMISSDGSTVYVPAWK